MRKKWKQLGKKHNLKLEVLGYPAISSFIIKGKNFLNYRTFITQEMLKKSILATNVVYLSTEHKKKYLIKYLRELDKIFKVIAECEKGKDIKSLLEVKKISTSFGRLN